MPDTGFYMTGLINPLQYIEADEPWSKLLGEEPSYESLLRFLCGQEVSSDLDSLLDRYREISQEKKRLSIAPAEPTILHKLI